MVSFGGKERIVNAYKISGYILELIIQLGCGKILGFSFTIHGYYNVYWDII